MTEKELEENVDRLYFRVLELADLRPIIKEAIELGYNSRDEEVQDLKMNLNFVESKLDDYSTNW